MGCRKAAICGFGDVGKGCAQAMRGCGRIVDVNEVDLMCAFQVCMQGYQVVTSDDTEATDAGIFINVKGNEGIIMAAVMATMKNNAIRTKRVNI